MLCPAGPSWQNRHHVITATQHILASAWRLPAHRHKTCKKGTLLALHRHHCVTPASTHATACASLSREPCLGAALTCSMWGAIPWEQACWAGYHLHGTTCLPPMATCCPMINASRRTLPACHSTQIITPSTCGAPDLPLPLKPPLSPGGRWDAGRRCPTHP